MKKVESRSFADKHNIKCEFMFAVILEDGVGQSIHLFKNRDKAKIFFRKITGIELTKPASRL